MESGALGSRCEGDVEMQAGETPGDAAATRYLRPGWFTRNVFNRIVVFLTKSGISVWARGSFAYADARAAPGARSR